jgi:hypothetical protein
MLDILRDPTLFTIEEKKLAGLWPPSKDNIADSIYPYIKRMKKEKINVLDVGVSLGETAYRLLELDTAEKIGKLICLSIGSKDTLSIASKNLENTKALITDTLDATVYDVVFINGELKGDLDNAFKTYYTLLDHNGIFGGNDHHTTHVKEALQKFRREERIGTPIHISNRLCWFWIKR